MNELGKWMMIGGLAIAGIGGVLWGVGRVGGWRGLPGDIHIERDAFSFHFPWVSCLLVSVVISALLWVFRK